MVELNIIHVPNLITQFKFHSARPLNFIDVGRIISALRREEGTNIVVHTHREKENRVHDKLFS